MLKVPLVSTLDEHRQPTEATLSVIRAYRGPWLILFAQIQTVWNHAETCFWKEGRVESDLKPCHATYRYSLQTGGWPGNQALVDALLSHPSFASLHTVRDPLHGRYTFEVALQQARCR